MRKHNIKFIIVLLLCSLLSCNVLFASYDKNELKEMEAHLVSAKGKERVKILNQLSQEYLTKTTFPETCNML